MQYEWIMPVAPVNFKIWSIDVTNSTLNYLPQKVDLSCDSKHLGKKHWLTQPFPQNEEHHAIKKNINI